MDPTVQAALIAAVAAVLTTAMGLLFRKRTKSAVVVRRSLDRQEGLESYVFVLRRQVFAAGKKPHPWPLALRYLNRDDADEESDDEPA